MEKVEVGMDNKETKQENHNPKLGFNLGTLTFCCTCHRGIKVGEMVITVTEDKKMCTSCGEEITKNFFGGGQGV